MKKLLLLGLLSTIYACSHPLEIVGEGDILSSTGTRNCYLEDFQAGKENCTKNLVKYEYKETYYAVPRAGWEFDKWINYCTDVVKNECAFAIPVDAVQKNWGTTVPSLVAVFMKTPVAPPEPEKPPAFPSNDQDGNVSFTTAKAIGDQGVIEDFVSSTQDADFFVFTASETADYSVTVKYSNPDIRLYWYNDDANKTLVGESINSGATSQSIDNRRLEAGRRYYLGVQAINQSSEQTYGLEITKHRAPHIGDLIISDSGHYVIDYDVTGTIIITNREAKVEIVEGTIEALTSYSGADLKVSGGNIGNIHVIYGNVEITGGNIASIQTEAVQGSVSGGTIKEFWNQSAAWHISGGTFTGTYSNIYPPTGDNGIVGGNFTGGFYTVYDERSSNRSFDFHGILTQSLSSIDGDVYSYRIAGKLADGTPVDQILKCKNYADDDPLSNSKPCDAVTISLPN